jgi:DNA polymerase/3'-5' exonuclease PolX
MPEGGKFMPAKVRRPREELTPVVGLLEKAGYVVAGSYRREKADVGDLDILIPPEFEFVEIVEEFKSLYGYEEIRGGLMKSEGIGSLHGSPLLLNLWRVREPKAWGAMLLYATGPYDLNIMMRARAKTGGCTLSQYGLFTLTDVQLDAGDKETGEQEIFAHLNLPYLTPVEREKWRDRLLDKKDHKFQRIHIDSSRTDDVYEVTIRDGVAIDCECKGFQYRGQCKHLAMAEAEARKAE